MNPFHVLIVEDEKHTRLSLRFILEDAGYTVTDCDNGQKALEIISAECERGVPVDLLVLDIQLPLLSGTDLLRELTKQNIFLPTLVITGYGEKKVFSELLRYGCAEYLNKPFAYFFIRYYFYIHHAFPLLWFAECVR